MKTVASSLIALATLICMIAGCSSEGPDGQEEQEQSSSNIIGGTSDKDESEIKRCEEVCLKYCKWRAMASYSDMNKCMKENDCKDGLVVSDGRFGAAECMTRINDRTSSNERADNVEADNGGDLGEGEGDPTDT